MSGSVAGCMGWTGKGAACVFAAGRESRNEPGNVLGKNFFLLQKIFSLLQKKIFLLEKSAIVFRKSVWLFCRVRSGCHAVVPDGGMAGTGLHPPICSAVATGWTDVKSCLKNVFFFSFLPHVRIFAN